MLHPVGSRSASTYWRRRLVLIGIAVLLVLTVYVVFFSGSATPSDTGALRSPTPSVSPSADSPTPVPASQVPASETATNTLNPAGGVAPTPTAAVPTTPVDTPTPAAGIVGPVSTCAQGSLTITAGTGAPSYPVSGQPVVFLQVTNTGPVPCSLDLADSQIELLVYNGASRVWGSHDCAVTPGVSVQTLSPNTPVARSITWSGLSSQPGACRSDQRTRVVAGTYTLHAKLAGVEGAPVVFSLT